MMLRESEECGLDGLTQLFNTVQYDNGHFKMNSCKTNGNRIGKDMPITNKSVHIKHKDDLISKCREYVK